MLEGKNGWLPTEKQKEHFKDYRIALVCSLFNRKYTQRMEELCLKAWEEQGGDPSKVEICYVPGAFELPLAAKSIFEKNKKIDGVLSLGVVIRGETPHFDYVCRSAQEGCMQVQLEFTKPVLFGLLTTENEKQVEDRIERSGEWILGLFQMISLLKNH